MELLNQLRAARLLLVRKYYTQAAGVFRVFAEVAEALALSLVDFDFFDSFADLGGDDQTQRARWYKTLHPKAVHDRLIAVYDGDHAKGLLTASILLDGFRTESRNRVVDFYSEFVHPDAKTLAKYRHTEFEGKSAFRVGAYPGTSPIGSVLLRDFIDFGMMTIDTMWRLINIHSSGEWERRFKSQNRRGFETYESLRPLWSNFFDLLYPKVSEDEVMDE